MIAAQLKTILSDIISPTQSAFLLGRMITDNATIAFGCFHKFQHGRNERDMYYAYKLDLAKATTGLLGDS